MSRSYVQPGDVMTYTAPSGGVVAGTGVLIGSLTLGALLVIPQETVAQTLPFSGYAGGVVSHAKIASQAWAEGNVVYWDNTNKWFTTAATVGFFRAGWIVVATGAGAGETTGVVRLSQDVLFPVSATYVQR